MRDPLFWQSILDHKGAIPESENLAELTLELRPYLSNPDPQLRDEFAYQLLAHWIMSGLYEPADLKQLLRQWQHNLTIGIGESDTDTVLTRSFSALMLSILVYYDLKTPWMSDGDFHGLADATFTYLLAEQDLRDYAAPVGWYHATAHTADILKFIARHPKSDTALHQRIIDTIARKLTHPQKHIYTHGEDERLALVVLDIAKRKLISQSVYKTWLMSLVATKDKFKPTIQIDEVAFGALQNVTLFLRALHITLAKNRNQLDAGAALEYAVFEELLKL